MRTYRYVTADVFTDRQFGGNQLAVILDARGLSGDEMLAITREFNYAESTFVLPSERGGDARVRIFTPGSEIPFAGHPTVGTAHVLVAIGRIKAEPGETRVVLEEGVGDVSVVVRTVAGDPEPRFAQLSVAQLPVESWAPSIDALAEVLSLEPSDFVGGDWAPVTASCGLPFIMAPLKTRDAVRRARVNLDARDRHIPLDAPSRELFAFTMTGDAPGAGSDVHSRGFVPGLAVPEDPATGSANAALAGYLAKRTPRLDGTLRWSVAQGVEMGRPSALAIEADKTGGAITAVRVGGSAVIVCEGTLKLRD